MISAVDQPISMMPSCIVFIMFFADMLHLCSV